MKKSKKELTPVSKSKKIFDIEKPAKRKPDLTPVIKAKKMYEIE